MKARDRWGYWLTAARVLARRPAAAAADGDLDRRLAMARHHVHLFALGAVLALVAVPWLGWWWAAVAAWAAVEAMVAAHRHFCLRTGRHAEIRHFLSRPGQWRPR